MTSRSAGRIRPGVLFFTVAITFQISWYVFLFISFFQSPGKLEGADFLSFYSVGKISAAYGFNQVYDLEKESMMQAQTAGVEQGSQAVLPANHPPLLFPLFNILTNFPYRTAYLIYLIFQCALLVLMLAIFQTALRKYGLDTVQVFLITIGVLLFEPWVISLLKGQDSFILLIAGILLLVGLLGKSSWITGLGLALTLIRPHLTLILSIPFLFVQRKSFFWFMLFALLFIIYGYLLVGSKGVVDYINITLLSAKGEGFGLAEREMFNLTGLILRIFPEVNVASLHLVGWMVYLLSVVGLCIWWGRSVDISAFHVAVLIMVGLFTVPHLHYHDLLIIAIPLVLLCLVGLKKGSGNWKKAGLILVISLLFIIFEFWDPARYVFPYILMAGVPAVIWWFEKHQDLDTLKGTFSFR